MKKTLFAFMSFLCLAGTAEAQTGWASLTSGTTAGFRYISLVGTDMVYVSGEIVIRSTDGGATWDSLTNMPSYRGIRMTSAVVQFVDDSTGFLCGSCDTVYRTTNDGQTWIAGTATGMPGGFPPVAMVFKTRYFGCIADGYGRTSRTTGGGVTWVRADEAVRFTCMAFADTLHGFGMGLTQPWLPDRTKPYAAGFAYSSNGAATIWTPSYAGPSADGRHTGATRDIYALVAISPDTLFAFGDRLMAAKSVDSGKNWDTIPIPGTNFYDGFSAACFSDRIHGTAVGTTGWVVRTSDGGVTWGRQNSGTSAFLDAVDFADSLIGYAAGDGGVIIKTTNGGLSWVRLSPGLDSIQGAVYPNPANNRTTISYPVPISQHVNLTLLDLSGAVVGALVIGKLQQGWQSIEVDTSKLPSGTYIYSLNSENYHTRGKIEVIH